MISMMTQDSANVNSAGPESLSCIAWQGERGSVLFDGFPNEFPIDLWSDRSVYCCVSNGRIRSEYMDISSSITSIARIFIGFDQLDVICSRPDQVRSNWKLSI